MKSKRGILKDMLGTGGAGYTSANMPLPEPTGPFSMPQPVSGAKIHKPAWREMERKPGASRPVPMPDGSGLPQKKITIEDLRKAKPNKSLLYGDMAKAPGVTPSPFPAPAIKPPVIRAPVSPFNRFQLGTNKALEPRKYTVRGMAITEGDLTEAEKILYSEISNRKGSKQNLELKHIIDTALNRMKEKNGATLTQILQAPNQYQGYAPKGTTRKGKVTESEYQRVTKGQFDEEKMAIVRAALDDLRNGKFDTGSTGATNYVHATDGTIWVGKTIQEAKQLARRHEKSRKIAPSQFGTTTGMPNY